MNQNDLEDFYQRCPILYHMAMDGSWPLISQKGLLNTDKLLEMFEVSKQNTAELTTKRRPASVQIQHEQFGIAVVRDQIPLLDEDLTVCLTDGITPLQWHQKLNERVFFWTNRKRLVTLLFARAYKAFRHDVVEVNTRELVEAYLDKIELTPMNSGCTRPWRHPRGAQTFLPVSEYPYQQRKKRGPKDDAVVELTVIGGVPDIIKYTIRAVKMQQGEVLGTLYQSTG